MRNSIQQQPEETQQKIRDEQERRAGWRTAELTQAYERLWHENELRRSMEEALSESEVRYRSLVELLPEAIFVLSENKVIFANASAARLLGAEKLEDIVGRETEAAIHPEYLEAIRMRIKLATEHDVVNPFIEYKMVRQDGSVIDVKSTSSHFVYQGKPAVLAVVHDITEHKKSERALRESEERFRQLAENSQDVFWIRDFMLGKVIYVSPAYEEIWGRKVEEFYQQQCTSFINGVHAEDRPCFIKAYEKCVTGERMLNDEFRVVHAGNDMVRWMWARAFPVYNERGELYRVVGIAKDITERKEAEVQRLEYAMAQRDTLIREVHHRIKNNLQGVVGLLRQHVAKQPEVREVMHNAINQINSIAIVHGLQCDSLLGQIRLSDMVANISRSAQELTQVCVDPIVDVAVLKPVQLRKEEAVAVALILNELIYNAIKHNVAPSDHACCPIRVCLNGDANAITIQIRNDYGKLPAGFDFAAGKGLGTGLSLVRSLLPRQGASLDFSADTDGRAVVVEFTLTAPVILNEAGNDK